MDQQELDQADYRSLVYTCFGVLKLWLIIMLKYLTHV